MQKQYSNRYIRKIVNSVATSDYTANIEVVDINDHYTISYSFNKKTRNGTKKMMIWLLDNSVKIAFYLFTSHNKRVNDKEITRKKFKINFIYQLIGSIRNAI